MSQYPEEYHYDKMIKPQVKEDESQSDTSDAITPHNDVQNVEENNQELTEKKRPAESREEERPFENEAEESDSSNVDENIDTSKSADEIDDPSRRGE